MPLVVNTVHGFYATETDGFLKRAVVYLMEAVAASFSDVELVQSKEDVDVMRRFHIGRRSRTVHLGTGSISRDFDLIPKTMCVNEFVSDWGYPVTQSWSASLGDWSQKRAYLNCSGRGS